MPDDPAREFAVSIARRLRDHGHVAYLAGGCVRDRLLGLVPADYDVATDARPDRIKALFRSAIGVGESFGVMLVRRGELVTEVATFRSDGEYLDRRRPDSIRFADEASDAARRDFTVNALFEDPIDGTIVDHVGGRPDLEARLLRAVGDPKARLSEDRLRVLRAIRFAARFGFRIEEGTEAAISGSTPALEGVSRERVGGELRRMLADPGRGTAARLLERFELDREVLGLPRTNPGFELLDGLGDEARDPVDALAAWLLDRGAAPDAAEREVLRTRLMLSNEESRRLARLFELVAIMDRWSELTVARRIRAGADELHHAAHALFLVRRPGPGARIREELDQLLPGGLPPDPLLDGDDLIEAGLRPGPRFKGILDSVYDAQLEGRVRDRSEALQHALDLAVEPTPETPQ